MMLRLIFDIIGQAPGAEKDAARIILICSILILVMIIFYLVVRTIQRRRMKVPPTADYWWTLEDLRKMRERGDLTQEEFVKLRATLIRSLGDDIQVPEGEDSVVWEAQSDDDDVVWEAEDPYHEDR